MTTQSSQSSQAGQPKTAIAKYENISDQVLARINTFTADGGLQLPKSYAVENHMKSAWLVLQEVKDMKGQPALKVCTKESIANALFDMVLQGMSVSKKQGYFIVYGNQLQFQRSYFGTIALAKSVKDGIATEPVANVIYDGDDFVYEIDPKTGCMSIVKHSQSIENIDDSKIKAAYAILTRKDGTTQVTIMTIAQIKAAWGQGATKGNSPAHKNFPAEMCKKTVIGRACKTIINSSDDAWLYDGKPDEDDVDTAKRQRDAAQATAQPSAAPSAATPVIDFNDVDYEEVDDTNAPSASAPSASAPSASAPAASPSASQPDDDPGY